MHGFNSFNGFFLLDIVLEGEISGRFDSSFGCLSMLDSSLEVCIVVACGCALVYICCVVALFIW